MKANIRYSFQNYDAKTMACAKGTNLAISHKDAREIAHFINGMEVEKAIAYLKEVVEAKKPIPYTRYKCDIPHRRGIATGRYPRNASLKIIELLESLKSNAQAKGLNTANLTIAHASALKGTKRRRSKGEMKNTHFEIIAKEMEKKEKEKTEKKK